MVDNNYTKHIYTLEPYKYFLMGDINKFLLYFFFLILISVSVLADTTPILVNPSNDELIDTQTPTFKWYSDEIPDKHILNVYDTSGNKLYSYTFTNPSYFTSPMFHKITVSLSRSTEYKWEIETHKTRWFLIIPYDDVKKTSRTFRIKSNNAPYCTYTSALCSQEGTFCSSNTKYNCKMSKFGCWEYTPLGSCQTCTNNPLCTKGTGTYCDGTEGWVTCESKNGCLTMTDGQSCAYGCNNGKCNPPPTIVCSSDSQCGSKTSIGTSCNGNSVIETFNIPKCINAGTSRSYCTAQSSTSTIKTCSSSETCSGGQCVSKPKCYQDSECGSPQFQEKKCNGNTVISVFKKPTCVSPGTPQALCDTSTFIEEVETLFCSSNEICQSGACIAKPKCYKDSDCGTSTSQGKSCDGNTIIDLLKIPKCLNSGTSSAYCTTENSKQTIQNCEDLNTQTQTKTYCKENDVRATQSGVKHSCLTDGTGTFCGRTETSGDWLVKSCASNEFCENSECKPKPIICGNGNCEQGENENNCATDCKIEKKAVIVYAEDDKESADKLLSSLLQKGQKSEKVLVEDLDIQQNKNNYFVFVGGPLANPYAALLSEDDDILFTFNEDDSAIIDNRDKSKPKLLHSLDFGMYYSTTNNNNNNVLFIAGVGKEGTQKAVQEFVDKDVQNFLSNKKLTKILAYPKLELVYHVKDYTEWWETFIYDQTRIVGVMNVGDDMPSSQNSYQKDGKTYFENSPVIKLSTDLKMHPIGDFFYGLLGILGIPSEFLPIQKTLQSDFKIFKGRGGYGTDFYTSKALKNGESMFILYSQDTDITKLEFEYFDKCSGYYLEDPNVGDVDSLVRTDINYNCQGQTQNNKIVKEGEGLEREVWDSVSVTLDVLSAGVGGRIAGFFSRGGGAFLETTSKTPMLKKFSTYLDSIILKRIPKENVLNVVYKLKRNFLIKNQDLFKVFERLRMKHPNVLENALTSRATKGTTFKQFFTNYDRELNEIIVNSMEMDDIAKTGRKLIAEPDLIKTKNFKIPEAYFSNAQKEVDYLLETKINVNSPIKLIGTTGEYTQEGKQLADSIINAKNLPIIKDYKLSKNFQVRYTSRHGIVDKDEFVKKFLRDNKELQSVVINDKIYGQAELTRMESTKNQLFDSLEQFFNNVAVSSISTTSNDLSLDNVELDGKDTTLLFNIKNTGQENLVEWEVMLDNQKIIGATKIISNSKHTVKVKFDKINKVHDLEIKIDPNDKIKEDDEENNKLILSAFYLKLQNSCPTNACSSVDKPGIYCGLNEPGVFSITPRLVTCEADAKGCLIVKNSKACGKCETPNSCLTQTTAQQQCTTDNDCGSQYYEGKKFCDNGNIFDHLIKPICKNNVCSKKEILKLMQECQNGCSGTTCADKKCTDNDGTDIFTKGAANGQEDHCIKYENNNRIKATECNNCFVIENICENDLPKTQTFNCENGCKEGKCLAQNNIPTIKTTPQTKTITTKANEKTIFSTDLNEDYTHEWHIDDKLFSKTKTFTFEPSTQYLGSHNIKLKIKINNHIFEDNWNIKVENNLEEKPDLEVKEIIITNKEGLKSNQQALIKITIRNNGLADVQEAELLFENKITQKHSLKSGEEKTIFTTMSFASPGNYNVQAKLDPQNLVEETNENNNQYMTSVVIG